MSIRNADLIQYLDHHMKHDQDPVFLDFLSYKPVELLLLMNPARFDEDDCFRLILGELILNGSLRYKAEYKQHHIAAPPARFMMIGKGENLGKTRLLHYEKIFLNPFRRRPFQEWFVMKPYAMDILRFDLGERWNLTRTILECTHMSDKLYPGLRHFFRGNLHLRRGKASYSRSLKECFISIGREILRPGSENSISLMKQLGSRSLLLPDFFESQQEQILPLFRDFVQEAYGYKREAATELTNFLIARQPGYYFDRNPQRDVDVDTN